MPIFVEGWRHVYRTNLLPVTRRLSCGKPTNVQRLQHQRTLRAPTALLRHGSRNQVLQHPLRAEAARRQEDLLGGLQWRCALEVGGRLDDEFGGETAGGFGGEEEDFGVLWGLGLYLQLEGWGSVD